MLKGKTLVPTINCILYTSQNWLKVVRTLKCIQVSSISKLGKLLLHNIVCRIHFRGKWFGVIVKKNEVLKQDLRHQLIIFTTYPQQFKTASTRKLHFILCLKTSIKCTIEAYFNILFSIVFDFSYFSPHLETIMKNFTHALNPKKVQKGRLDTAGYASTIRMSKIQIFGRPYIM